MCGKQTPAYHSHTANSEQVILCGLWETRNSSGDPGDNCAGCSIVAKPTLVGESSLCCLLEQYGIISGLSGLRTLLTCGAQGERERPNHFQKAKRRCKKKQTRYYTKHTNPL